MKRSYANNIIRYTAGIIAVMMLLVMLLSSFYIAVHADHDCTGDDCPVCAFIQQCENTVRGMGSGLTVASTAAIPLFLIYLSISSGVSFVAGNTPVSRKVRLNN